MRNALLILSHQRQGRQVPDKHTDGHHQDNTVSTPSICAGCEVKGIRAPKNPSFEGGILNFMDGIPNFMGNFNAF